VIGVAAKTETPDSPSKVEDEYPICIELEVQDAVNPEREEMSGVYVNTMSEVFEDRPVYRSLDGEFIMYYSPATEVEAEGVPGVTTTTATWWVGQDDADELDPINGAGVFL